MRHTIPTFKQRQEFHRPFWDAMRRIWAQRAARLADDVHVNSKAKICTTARGM